MLCRRLPKIPRLIMQTNRKRLLLIKVTNIKLRTKIRHKFRQLFKSNNKREAQLRLSPLNLPFSCHTMALDRTRTHLLQNPKHNLSHSNLPPSKLSSFHQPNLSLLLAASSLLKARDLCRSPETPTYSKGTI